MALIQWFRSRIVVRLALTMLAVALLPLGATGYLVTKLTERSLADQIRSNQQELAASGAVLVEQYVLDGRAKLRTVARLIGNLDIQPRDSNPLLDAERRQKLAQLLNTLLTPGDGAFLDLKYFHVGKVDQTLVCGPQVGQQDYQDAQQRQNKKQAYQTPEVQRGQAEQDNGSAPRQSMDVKQQQAFTNSNLLNDVNSAWNRNYDTVPDKVDLDQLVFAMPLSGGEYVSPTLGLADDIPFLAISVPIQFTVANKGDKPQALLVAGIDFRPVLQRLANLAGPRRSISIDDGLKPLAASPPPTGPEIGNSTLPFGGEKWKILIQESRASAFEPLRQARFQTLALLGASGGMALILSVLFAGWILRPVRSLTGAAHKMRGGDLKTRAGIHRHDEIGELAKAFDQMAAALEELDRTKSDFVSHVSHELRTPLTSMKLSMANLVDGVVGPLDERQQAVVRRTSVDLDRLIRMVNELLDIAKLEAGKIELMKEPVDLADVAKSAAGTLAPLAAEKGVVLNVAGGHSAVDADRSKMLQVVINLVDNAIKFTPRGGRVDVAIRPREIEVKDSGCGIPADALPRIFDKFAKVGDVRESRAVGAGLGLSICKRLVELHGGSISAASVPGQGSVFTVRI